MIGMGDCNSRVGDSIGHRCYDWGNGENRGILIGEGRWRAIEEGKGKRRDVVGSGPLAYPNHPEPK